MNKNLLLASLMISMLGVSSLRAEEEKQESITSHELSCDKCSHLEEEILEEVEEKTEELSQADKTETSQDDESLSCDCDKKLSSKDDERV